MGRSTINPFLYHSQRSSFHTFIQSGSSIQQTHTTTTTSTNKTTQRNPGIYSSNQRTTPGNATGPATPFANSTTNSSSVTNPNTLPTSTTSSTNQKAASYPNGLPQEKSFCTKCWIRRWTRRGGWREVCLRNS